MPKALSEKPVVHVVDDDPSVRRALESLFRSVGLEARTYSSAQEFVASPKKDVPSCIVLDVRMPGMSGLEVQSRLVGLGIYIPVILITGYADIPMTVKGMKAGAVDFLAKPFREQDIIDSVINAIEKDRKQRASNRNVVEIADKFSRLSPREKQVMLLVTKGKLNKQVAGELGITEVTVKLHRGAVMHKMGAQTLADLVRMADALEQGYGFQKEV